jgi:hypothetical protein
MNRREFFQKIKEDYFNDLTCEFKDFKEMVCGVMPVFGVLEIEYVRVSDHEKVIIFKDIDEAMFVIGPEGSNVTLEDLEDLDMSGQIMKITMDGENVIHLVEHGVRMFTPANKDTVLFLGSIIGKKLLNIDEGLN